MSAVGVAALTGDRAWSRTFRPRPLRSNGGRWIGNLERALLLAIIAEGSYPAIALLIAAKGLIGSKELENRDFAEYFLVGTFASIGVALASGILIRAIIVSLWT